MITPPRWIERLLSSFGAEPGYRDALLGDLAEEFTIRVEEQSAGIARRWYFREALRSAPHLFGSWLRRVGARDVLQLAGITVAALFAMRLFGIAIRLAIVLSFGVRPDSASIIELAWRDISSESLAWALVPIVLTRAATLGLGVAGASLYPKARMFLPLWFAGLYVATMAAGLASTPRIVLWFAPLDSSLVLAGGLLRVVRSKAEVVERRASVARPIDL